MLTVLISIGLVLILCVLGLCVWLIVSNFASRESLAARGGEMTILQQQVEAIKTAQENLRQTLDKSLQKGQENLSQSLIANQKTISQLNSQIGQLQGSNKQMLRIGDDVRRLQDIMASPKMRGQLGEWSLENLLTNILPLKSFSLQHSFKGGQIVDALIFLADYSVPVDAKFPLPAFEAILAAEDDEAKVRLRRQFHRDVTKHIDKIASAYIRPDEGTLDFAMMYIPAENVYYETIVKYDGDKTDMLEYALAKKVIPASPNMLYAYLMTVVMGLHGLQIEKHTAQIRENLKKLNASFAEFTSKWDVLGKHLRNAQNQYEEGNQKLDKFGFELTQIQEDQNETE